ncbi:MAG: pimeloyl-ACP methyl ester carboxylesterase [Roseivirga sp.]|jgi:pimeloyl-ACP methyl ester carboxylesterase
MNKIFKVLKRITLYTVSIILLSSITGYIYLYVLPKGPEITEASPIKDGKDSFVMYAYKQTERKSIKVWTYKPQNWNDGDKIVFVMHGGGRNADDYLDAWVAIAEENNLFIVAPEFENKFSKYITNDYQEGNLFTFFGMRNPKEEWAYTVVENVFDHIKSVNSFTNEHYDIFGHSAGGQFVHRMIMLMPESRIRTAISANAGFYSLPNENLEFPYGIKNSGMDLNSDLQKAYEKRLVILLGELDNDPSLGTFRTTDLAMEQGTNRLERGTNFYNLNKKLKSKNNWTFNWEIDTIKNVGHSYQEMSENAVDWIKN